ncbi:MAG: hypothetical protein EPN99_07545 [Frankiales bacterium]|nr:MAG: hypothetical protein EPN99_07545 [Frankiales bacterium]
MSVADGLLLVHGQQEPAAQPDLRFDRPLIAGLDEWGLHLSTGAQDHSVDVRLTVSVAAPGKQPCLEPVALRRAHGTRRQRRLRRQLHPSPAGLEAMAASIDLPLFKPRG